VVQQPTVEEGGREGKQGLGTIKGLAWVVVRTGVVVVVVVAVVDGSGVAVVLVGRGRTMPPTAIIARRPFLSSVSWRRASLAGSLPAIAPER
jgi:hypothetical protein